MRSYRLGAGVVFGVMAAFMVAGVLVSVLSGCGGGGGGGGATSQGDVDGVRLINASIDSAPLVVAGEELGNGGKRVAFAQFGGRFWPGGERGESASLQVKSLLSNQVVAMVDISKSGLGERLSNQLERQVGRYGIFVSGLSEDGSLKGQLVEESTGVSDPGSAVIDILHGVAGAGSLRVGALVKEVTAAAGETPEAVKVSLDVAEGAQGVGLVVSSSGGDRVEAENGSQSLIKNLSVTILAETISASGQPSGKIYEESFPLEQGARYTLLLAGQPGYLVVGSLVKK